MSHERGKNRPEPGREEDREQTEELVEAVEESITQLEEKRGAEAARRAEKAAETGFEDPMEWVRLAGEQAESAVVAAVNSAQAGRGELSEETYDFDPAIYDLPKESGRD